jgi:sugar phosphate isomerase/epimerase
MMDRSAVEGMSLDDAALAIAETNIGAMVIISDWIHGDPAEAARLLEILDDMNIRGVQLACAFTCFANKDREVLAEGIRQRDPRLVETVNAMVRDRTHTAVVRGGSPGRGQIVS